MLLVLSDIASVHVPVYRAKLGLQRDHIESRGLIENSVIDLSVLYR
jgi:hypothetical protein